MKTSGMFKLNLRDLLNGALIAILAPILVIVQQTIDAGSLTFDWKHITMAAIGGFAAYLIKNFLTPKKDVDTTKSS